MEDPGYSAGGQTRSDEELERLLEAVRAGEPGAEARLATHVYDTLRSQARALMLRERADHTLQPTALVNETFLRFRSALASMQDRKHLFAAFSTAMKRVLVDHARGKNAAKRRADVHEHVPLEIPGFAGRAAEFDEALDDLARVHERARDVVVYRHLVGLTIDEVARQLGVSTTTVGEDWVFARAWLMKYLSG